MSETKQGAKTAYRYVQSDVHDFAWTADPRFVVHEFRFEPPKDIPAGWSAAASRELGMTEAEIALTPVSVRLLLQPDHLRAKDRYVLSAKQALSFYGLWFGAYPYETLTIVDPPDDGEGSGGMEYPTFITGGTLRYPPPLALRARAGRSKTSRSTSSATSTGTEWSARTSSRNPGSTRD